MKPDQRFIRRGSDLMKSMSDLTCFASAGEQTDDPSQRGVKPMEFPLGSHLHEDAALTLLGISLL
jgi:hypothetical protein